MILISNIFQTGPKIVKENNGFIKFKFKLQLQSAKTLQKSLRHLMLA